MKIYALVGESGTGKSFHAMQTAKQNGIEYMIDDGLFIGKGKIIAGKSAKAENNVITSVKRAVFMFEDSREEVKNAIKIENPHSVLILGTSEKMVDRIAAALEIGSVEKYIDIHEVATEEEIKIAKNMREKQGKHIIPVPAFEVKKRFSGYFLDPIKVFFRLGDNAVHEDNKTIIRPTYSYFGEYVISPNVVQDICRYAANKIIGVKCRGAKAAMNDGGVNVNVDISVKLNVPMREAASAVQHRVKQNLEDLCGLTVLYVNVKIVKLD